MSIIARSGADTTNWSEYKRGEDFKIIDNGYYQPSGNRVVVCYWVVDHPLITN